MSSRPLSPQPVETQSPDQVLEHFEAAWQSGTPPDLAAFIHALAPANPNRQLLLDLIRLDLEYRWRLAAKAAGSPEPLLLERYIEQFPALASVADLPDELIGEEYLVRHWLGDRPGHAEYLNRFPERAANLQATLVRLDEELADDFSSRGKPKPSLTGPPATPTNSDRAEATQVVPLLSARDLLDSLRRDGLLSLSQLNELILDDLKNTFPDAQALAQNLVRRRWLTEFQASLLIQGRGSELLVGPYLLIERLGEGGTGHVFKASHKTMRRDVALKIIRKELLADPDVVSRFYREIRIVGQLDHPNIVHAYDAGPIGAAHCLAMEFIEGIDLARRVREAGPLPVPVACDYIAQAARGLQHAHEHGLVHRDIKPPNLLLANGGRKSPDGIDPAETVKILDLGLARLHRHQRIKPDGTPAEDLNSLVTPQGSIMMGTPDYMAPEQALDFHGADIRADIYGLGCTLFYLLAGQPPFPGGTLAQKLLHHQNAPAPPIATLRPDVPPPVAEILNRMLAKNAAERYQTPAQVAEALAPWSRNAGDAKPTVAQPTVAPPVAAIPAPLPVAQLMPADQTVNISAPSTPASLPSTRRSVAFLAPALLGGVLLAILVGWIALGGKSEPSVASRPRPSEPPRAKATAAPKTPGLLFVDHFETGNLNHWKKPASHTWRVEANPDGKGNVLTGGTFSPPDIDSTDVREDTALYCGDPSWTDYAIDTWVRYSGDRSPTKRFYGVILFGRARPSVNYWLEYGVFGQGEGEGRPNMFLFKRMGGKEFKLADKREVPKLTVGQWQHIRFELEGKHLRGYIDDRLCIQAEDDSLTTGRAGLTLSNVATTCAKIEWKDFRVQSLPPDAKKPEK